MNNRTEYYQSKIEELVDEYKLLTQRSKWMLLLKLASFALFAYSVYLIFLTDKSLFSIISSVVFLSLYICWLIVDSKLQNKINTNQNIRKIYAHELMYFNGDYSAFNDGSNYIDPSHPFTFDLDIFGKDSLFNRINRTITTLGSDHLANKLQFLLSDRKSIEQRKEAITELSENEPWRTKFIALLFDKNSGLETAVKIVKANFHGRIFLNGLLHKTMLVSVFATLLTSILSGCSIIPAAIPTSLFFIQLLVCMAYSLKFNKISSEVNGVFKGFSVYASLIEHILSVQFRTTVNKTLQDNLNTSENSAVIAFKELSVILNLIEQRANAIFYILLNGLFLYDLFLLRKFVIWKNKYLNHIDLWIDVIAEFDSLISLATYRFNSPQNVDAVINVTGNPFILAKEVYHPFIPRQKAVANDFQLEKSSFAIITGANMAGKSTFLRTIGVNYILAMNGMTVCASSFEVSIMDLFSSMRTSDNLTNNISYFNAELIRLEKLIKHCQAHEHTLIILDEILKGTNSRDKLDGSRLFLQKISKLCVSGIIATHDLDLAGIEESSPEKFKNYCFEIELTEEIDYTYKISRGVAKNLNATYLLKKIMDKI